MPALFMMTASWSAVRPVTGWRWSRPATLPSGRRSASSAANSLSSLFDRTASTSALPPRASRLAPSPERELGVCTGESAHMLCGDICNPACNGEPTAGLPCTDESGLCCHGGAGAMGRRLGRRLLDRSPGGRGLMLEPVCAAALEVPPECDVADMPDVPAWLPWIVAAAAPVGVAGVLGAGLTLGETHDSSANRGCPNVFADRSIRPGDGLCPCVNSSSCGNAPALSSCEGTLYH
mmetsp:Transcript_36618/g.108070  ORF Transcript_36618/g.108070 Transcript_36618/m.108070 type:complete len:235 (-) Transcript_36618:734-1438(-)